ncbi:MAG: thiamine phosphate synthase [Candidatus Omnitrophica bacterium]|nr:thiamine phosphate synthase [Candidatus Omnitrophota bacterium]
MKSKKKQLERSQLYVIIDKDSLSKEEIFKIVKKIKNQRIDIIQYRDKSADKNSILENTLHIKEIIKETKSIFIINDYLDIAKIIDADGIHLGQEDVSIEIARRILGRDKIIGISCHSLRQAKVAQEKGADYLGIGPVFPSPTKQTNDKTLGLSLLKRIKEKINLPFFAIGGINLDNLKTLLELGIRRIAVSSAICLAPNPEMMIKAFFRFFRENDAIRISQK